MVSRKKTKKLTLYTSLSGRRGEDQMTFLINDLLYYCKGVTAPREVCPLVDHRGRWQYNIIVDSIIGTFVHDIYFVSKFFSGG